MNLYDSFDNLPSEAKNAVIAIGNFDGVHRGHQTLFDTARKIAKKNGVAFGVLTFEPHPRSLLRKDEPAFRLTPPSVKWRRLKALGIDFIIALEFDWDFASQTPEAFMEDILSRGIQPQHIVVGNDFCFGQMRKGNVNTLKEQGFNITALDKVEDEGGGEFSSTNIRQALRQGDIQVANKLLGWPWEIEGQVFKGDQRGRTIGYPTANVKLAETLHPSYGVYATWVKIVEDGTDAPWLMAATNIGIRPMFEVPVGQVESFIFDFDRDIYDHTLRIRPVKKLRGEARFDSLEDLVKQIDKDCDQALQILEEATK